MIVWDADNLTGYSSRPTPEAIREDLRRQRQALKDIRRRLSQSSLPTPATILPPRA